MMNISSVNTTAGTHSDKSISSGPMKEIAPINTVKFDEGKALEVSTAVKDQEQSKKSIDRIIQSVQGPNTTIERSIHEETNHILYKVKDKETGEVIREIPEEKLLDMAAKLMELNGMLIDEKI